MQDEDFVIHIFGVQSVMNQRGTDISALENITLAVDLLSGPEPARDAGKAQASGRMEAADVASLLCRLRFRECLLKVLTAFQVASITFYPQAFAKSASLYCCFTLCVILHVASAMMSKLSCESVRHGPWSSPQELLG